MPKAFYIPKDDASKGPWLSNFAQKLPEHAAAVGVTPAEEASVAADNTFWAYVYDAQNQIKNNAQEWTAYKNGLRSGPAIGELPTLPTLGPAPAEVAAEIFGRIAALVARIKNHPGYTESIGQDLGIIGAEQTIDFENLKPVLKLSLKAGHPNVGWTKQGLDALEIWVDRGSGTFAFLAIDTVPDYLDTAPLPAPGASAVWKYKAIYRLTDEPVGQWSDVAALSVMG
jgi:hypothetical protein